MPPDLLPDSVWGATPRDPQVSPLYIRRYAGPRHPEGRLDAHDFWELIYTFAGEGVLETDVDRSLAHPGVAYLVPPGLGHRELTERSGWEVLWVGFNGSLTASWPTDRGVFTASTGSLAAAVEQLWLWSTRQPGAIGPELDALTGFIVRAVWRLSQRREPEAGDWLERVLGHMHEHLAEDLQMSDLARVADRSLGHFQRSFKAEMGETPLACLTRLRLEMAVAYLRESTHSVAHIAELCGWRDALYFSRICRRHLGQSPSELRR